MYAYIKGHLSQLFPTHIVVETSNGIDLNIFEIDMNLEFEFHNRYH
jgi:hypothetical protein